MATVFEKGAEGIQRGEEFSSKQFLSHWIFTGGAETQITHTST